MKKVIVAITLYGLIAMIGAPVCLAAPVLPALPPGQNINPSTLTNIILAPSQLSAVADGT